MKQICLTIEVLSLITAQYRLLTFLSREKKSPSSENQIKKKYVEETVTCFDYIKR